MQTAQARFGCSDLENPMGERRKDALGLQPLLFHMHTRWHISLRFLASWRLAAKQTGKSKADANKALEATNGDIAEAILKLTEK